MWTTIYKYLATQIYITIYIIYIFISQLSYPLNVYVAVNAHICRSLAICLCICILYNLHYNTQKTLPTLRYATL